MTKPNVFKSSEDFRKSLEHRLQQEARDKGIDLQRVSRRVAFDRLLARFFSDPEPPFFLKGGYAMELRIASSRATKDMDLTYLRRFNNQEELASDLILNQLQALAAVDLGDYFLYRVESAQLTLDNAPYGGFRYPVVSHVAGRLFVQFHLDVGVDFLVANTETIMASDWLDFCGISAPFVRMISVEQQIAEKIHAYTLPREHRMNSRVKDLIDILLLTRTREPDLCHLALVLLQVFQLRKTHPAPPCLLPPPIDWTRPYASLASECGLETDIATAFQEVSSIYLNIVQASHGTK
jgi:hypothetical protein